MMRFERPHDGDLRRGIYTHFEPLTVAVRLSGSGLQHQVEALRLHQAVGGLDVAGVKKVDVRRAAVGFGVRAGGHAVAQWFDTPGSAEPRWGLFGRVGPVIGLDIPFGGSLVTLGGGTDVQFYRRYDALTGVGGVESYVVPTFSVEWTRYVH